MSYQEAWGYSKLACYKECPQKFKFQFIDKLPIEGSPAMERGSKLHDSCEAYLQGWDKEIAPELFEWGIRFDELKAKGVVCEQSWGFDRQWRKLKTWFEPTTWLRAKSDAHYIDGTELVVIDFKSGKYKVPPIEQIELYAICGYCIYPIVTKVRTEFWYLDQDQIYSTEYMPEHLEMLKKKYEDAVTDLYEDEVFEPEPSRDCKWCSYSRSKNGPCTAG